MPSRPSSPNVLDRVTRLFRRETGVTTEEITGVSALRLGGERALTVYLPPGYDPDDRRRRWPLLVAHDGQQLPEWRLAEALTQHHAAGGDTPIVAALPTGDRRLDDYGTAGILNAQGYGARAADFQAYVVHSVLPLLAERYRLHTAAGRFAVMGASLGGLSAFDLAWRHPGVFGHVGVFSGSFWWRTDDAGVAAQQASRIAHRRVLEAKTKPALRLWLQTGTRDETADRDGNGVIDAIQDTTELIDALAARGFRRGHDVVYREIEGGEHHPGTWAQALPEFLRWAFPAR